MYDTLESALKQKEHLKVKSEVVASMKQSAEKNAPPSHMQSALGALGGAGAAVSHMHAHTHTLTHTHTHVHTHTHTHTLTSLTPSLPHSHTLTSPPTLSTGVLS